MCRNALGYAYRFYGARVTDNNFENTLSRAEGMKRLQDSYYRMFKTILLFFRYSFIVLNRARSSGAEYSFEPSLH